VIVRTPAGALLRRDFTGIHVIAPEVLHTLQRPDIAPSIVTHYLSLAKTGARIDRFEQEGAMWVDIGSHEKLAWAETNIDELTD
jgi:hypothetical protein